MNADLQLKLEESFVWYGKEGNKYETKDYYILRFIWEMRGSWDEYHKGNEGKWTVDTNAALSDICIF